MKLCEPKCKCNLMTITRFGASHERERDDLISLSISLDCDCDLDYLYSYCQLTSACSRTYLPREY